MSAKPDDRERLVHILEAIGWISKFTQDMDFETFAENEMAQFAIIKNFEIIGEAAYHLSVDIKDENPEVEWRKIIAFRHIRVHDYYQINLQIVWNAREGKLQILRKQIEHILDK
ncbi:MAG: DUF86 domain-containing protein [Phaeodactylibacter sp.]|nr:DUF86 domain-containing protein [Phaeodactylibacter sp.]MCB9299104.1 DUF86 domain-containing protein [Lewinellaceae bacterium]